MSYMDTLLINGEEIEAQAIGSGAFAKAYLYGEKVILNVVGCRFRDALASLTTPIPHLPVIKKIAEDFYEMPYYENVDMNSPEYYIAQKLFEIYSLNSTETFMEILETTYPTFVEAFKFMIGFLETYKDEVRFDITDYSYEMHDSNLAMDTEGNIILRDPIADWNAEMT